ncbi:Heavy metal transport/detoxification superfamily protein [Forsythia ovata]|uniref:Heavy metal transport/detoxification superfamily protein n=1 Tax=Forsythia ovata TaxID=205694 RepID=A0ABD1X6C3_9LAMI
MPPVTTAVLKVHLHCEGCIQKIHKIVTKTKGYDEMKIDRQKDTVTVAGAMDMKALAETLKKHLKREVEILLPKKEGGGGGGGEKKEKGGGDKGKGGGDDKGKSGSKDGGGGDKGKGGGELEDAGGEKMEGNKMQFQFGNPYPSMYGAGQMGDQFQYHPHGYGPYHAPQIFSDENPNACSVM